MTDIVPSFSCRYHLSLDEAKEGFALATFGKKKFARFVTPLISIAIIIWGLSLGVTGVGKFYVILGVTFLILQLVLRFIFLPKMFARQYTKYKFGEMEQGIDLYQNHGVLIAADRQQNFNYSDVVKFVIGKVSYMLELKDRTVIIVSKSSVMQTGQQALFESVFKQR
ncbi:MAG: hypothetical protein LKF82_08985 [Acinetobacter populi]|jgi:hypothetical protein|uniref:hypothetical protein n=1 Tax=Acinetobacter populi TaxID=1582270 RepID=UPI002355DA95|nr:hypothetical protein [Acinetobacter populi]MCH4247955.1 hypothetical protein [Acinetobacter populi]